MADDRSDAAADGDAPKRRKLVRRNVLLQPKRIACTDCGSPVEVKNAAMAEMVSCAACGAVLDLESDDTQVLAKILLDKRPPAPLQLGQRGRLKGVTWEVVGRVRMRDGISMWNEFLLFSSKKGYAWLQVEQGHWTFLKKSKSKPALDPRVAAEDQTFRLYGMTFKVYEKSSATVDYIEGEFPYQAAVGDKLGYMDAISPPHMVCAEWTAKEVEWTAGDYVEPARIAEAFGLKPEDLPRRSGVGACQPYAVPPWRRAFAWSAGIAAVLCVALAIYSGMTGRRTKAFSVPATQYLQSLNAEGFLSEPFEVSQACIEQIEFKAPVNNSWVYLECLLLDETQAPVLSWTEEISYYHGHDWSEGSQSSSTVFRVDEPGRYRLAVRGQGGAGNTGSVPRRETVTVTVWEGVVLTRYFIVAAILFALVPILEIARRGGFEAKRNED
ncbi:MAG: DUF4178 domain-containing protein [Planctomycetota bacterium]